MNRLSYGLHTIPLLLWSGFDDHWFISPASHILEQDSPWIHLLVKKPICVVQHVVGGGSGVVHLRHSDHGCAHWWWAILVVLWSPRFITLLLAGVIAVEQGTHCIALVACKQLNNTSYYIKQCLQSFLRPTTQCWCSVLLLIISSLSFRSQSTSKARMCVWMAKMPSSLTKNHGSQ